MTAMTGEELTRRLNTIAANAIREAQIAKGRGNWPWIDDDWRRANMIAQILDLHTFDKIDVNVEHYPLTSPAQAPKNELLDRIGNQLAEALSRIPDEEEDPQITDSVSSRPKVTRK